MATQNEASSFQAMIEADRQRKKNEDLAASIFGRKQSGSSSQKGRDKDNKKDARSPSLASRMGVQKRHSSSTTTPTQKSFSNARDGPSISRPSSTNPSQQRRDSARATRLATDINSNTNVNIRESPSLSTSFSQSQNPPRSRTSNGSGLKILGAAVSTAGPFTVLATNFAPGTTSADIEASFQHDFYDDQGQNSLQSCRIVRNGEGGRGGGEFAAELVFAERAVAEGLVQKYNGLKADGRILGFSLVQSSSNSGRGRRNDERATPSASEAAPIDLTMSNAEDGDMEIDDGGEAGFEQSSYDREREAADRDRRDRERDRDGNGNEGRRDDRDRGRERDDDRRRDDRDRDRDRDRRDDRHDDRERDRNRDADRDRERERERERDRDGGREYPRDSYRDDRDRQPRPAFGNGTGGYNGPPQQQGYGGYSGGGGGGYRARGGFGYGGPRGGGGGGGGYGGPRGAYGGGSGWSR